MRIAQLVERWSPKPKAEGSTPSAHANIKIMRFLSLIELIGLLILLVVTYGVGFFAGTKINHKKRKK